MGQAWRGYFACIVWASAGLIACIGCRPPNRTSSRGSEDATTNSSPATTVPEGTTAGETAQAAPQRLPTESIAPSEALGDYLPALDQQRLEIAPPAQWKLLPRSSDYVVRFSRVKSGKLPRILVSAQDALAPLREGGDGLPALLEAVQAETAGQTPWTQRPRPVILGQRAAVMYAVPASSDGVTVERVIIETVLGPRRYRLELQTYPEFLKTSQPALYAVVAGMRAASEQSVNPPPGGQDPLDQLK